MTCLLIFKVVNKEESYQMGQKMTADDAPKVE
jgi:hypothetical protein